MRRLLFTLLLMAISAHGGPEAWEFRQGGIVRGPENEKKLALEFTADEFTEGGSNILNQLAARQAKASFFLTGRCLREPEHAALIKRIVTEGHYLGSHSDSHPLLCPWTGPKNTLVTREFFENEMNRSIEVIEKFGVRRSDALYFIPPYEWYNAEISKWSGEMGLRLINFTPGTRSNADYTEDGARNFASSKAILDSIKHQDQKDGLNGFLLLMHLGVGPKRTDKMSDHIGELIDYLQARGYKLVRVDELLSVKP